MSTAKQFNLVSIKDYLVGEQASDVKHEYLAGVVYAMVGATNAHNIIATNLIGMLRNQLTESGCRAFNSDTKVRIQSRNGTRFYYPDAQVVCQPNAQTDTFQDSPAVIFEVLSPSTRRIDASEKKENYLSIASLSAYIMIEPDTRAAIVFRRVENGFERRVYDQSDSVIQIDQPDMQLSFQEIYQDIVSSD